MSSSTLTPPFSPTATEPLALRIHGTARDGQIVRLRSPKCTVGSGPRCTLRLRARGVGPLHCLIVRGPCATIVRRWSADTRLNGQAFTDAQLLPGDRLSIGAIELEVLETAAEGRRDAQAAWAPPSDAWQQQPWQAEREELQRQVSERDEQLTALRAEWDARQKTLEEEQAQLAECRHGLEQWRSQLETRQQALEEDRRRGEARQNEATARMAERSQQLAARQAELETRERALAQRQQQWQAEREESEQQLNARTDATGALQAELEAGREALKEERRRWEARQSETTSRTAEQSQQFAARQADLNARERALAQRRQQWQAECEESERKLAEQAQQLRASQAELETQQEAVKQRLLQENAKRAEDRPAVLEATPSRRPRTARKCRPPSPRHCPASRKRLIQSTAAMTSRSTFICRN